MESYGFSAGPAAATPDDDVLREYRRRKSMYTAAEWRSMGPDSKSQLLEEARRDTLRGRDVQPKEIVGVAEESKMDIVKQMCARAKAIADLRRIEAALSGNDGKREEEENRSLTVDDATEEDVEIRLWPGLRFGRSGSPPPPSLPSSPQSEIDVDMIRDEGDEITSLGYSVQRAVFCRSLEEPVRRRSPRLVESTNTAERQRKKSDEKKEEVEGDDYTQQPAASTRDVPRKSRTRRNRVTPEQTSDLSAGDRRRSVRIFLAADKNAHVSEATSELIEHYSSAQSRPQRSDRKQRPIAKRGQKASDVVDPSQAASDKAKDVESELEKPGEYVVETPKKGNKRKRNEKKKSVEKEDDDLAPPLGTSVQTVFDDGINYSGVVIGRPAKNVALVRYEDGDEEEITFPDPDVTIVEDSVRKGGASFQEKPESLPEDLPQEKNESRQPRACAIQMNDAKLAAQLQEEELRSARRERTLRERGAQPRAAKQRQQPRQQPRRQQPQRQEPLPPPPPQSLPPPTHVLFSTPLPPPRPPSPAVPGAQAEAVSASILEDIPAEEKKERVLVDSSHETARTEQGFAGSLVEESMAREAHDKPATPRKSAEFTAKTEIKDENFTGANVPDEEEEDPGRCPLCLSDDGIVVSLWCCRKRACHSCLGRLGDFGFRCFFCRASVPPRRIRAMLSDEPEWPPARPAAGNLVKRAFTIGPEVTRHRRVHTPKKKRRREEDTVEEPTGRSMNSSRDLDSSLDFIGEVIALDSNLWYSSREDETPNYVANALLCSSARLIALTNTSSPPQASSMTTTAASADAPILSEYEALADGRMLRLPPGVAPTTNSGSGEAIWIVPPRLATELLAGEACVDALDQRVWYSTKDDETPERIASLFDVDVGLVVANTAKLAHLSTRRSTGSTIRCRLPEALGKRARLKARTVVLLPRGTKIPDSLARRKPCAVCRIGGNRGAFSCRQVLGHTAPGFDSPEPTIGARVRVRWQVPGADDDQTDTRHAPVWGWYLGTIARVDDGKIFVVYDGEGPAEDEQVWPSEDVVMLPKKDDAGTSTFRLLTRMPDNRLLQYLVGQHVKHRIAQYRVTQAYASLVEGFDGPVVVLSRFPPEAGGSIGEDHHHLIFDFRGEGYSWVEPKAAQVADALLRGLSADDDPNLAELLVVPEAKETCLTAESKSEA